MASRAYEPTPEEQLRTMGLGDLFHGMLAISQACPNILTREDDSDACKRYQEFRGELNRRGREYDTLEKAYASRFSRRGGRLVLDELRRLE